ncbi:MAG: response regulator [Nanoarchaeota archaeon]|nr:response regulator [Nanoarchaeota archaeon]
MVNKVLVIDDEFEDLKLIKSILERKGFRVTAVTSGSRAVEALAGCKFDLIIVDILMPTLGGYELLKILSEKRNHGTKVLYLSIAPMKEIDTSHSDAFIQKPFSPEKLMISVNNTLKKKKKRA